MGKRVVHRIPAPPRYRAGLIDLIFDMYLYENIFSGRYMLLNDPPQTTISHLDLRSVGNFVSQMGSRVTSIGSREFTQSSADLINIGHSLQRVGSEIALSQQLNSSGSVFSDAPF